MQKVEITSLKLQNFRIHKHFVADIHGKVVLLLGDNGVGKTSVIEAISMLSPGKGILSASPAEQIYNSQIANNAENVAASYAVEIELEKANLIGFYAQTSPSGRAEKSVTINSKPIGRQTDLSQWCDVLWFTSQMQYDLSGSGFRRKFFDRLVFYLFPKHATIVNVYEKLIKERMAVLENGGNNHTWLVAIERQIATAAADIAQNRMQTCSIINACSQNEPTELLRIKVAIDGDCEQFFQQNGDQMALHLHIMQKLEVGRAKDAVSGRTQYGVHRSDIDICGENGVSFAVSSSGQQKMIFLSLVEIAAKVIGKHNNRMPIVLLDEMISFLDEKNLAKIINSVINSSSQVWVTNATEPVLPSNSSVQILKLGV